MKRLLFHKPAAAKFILVLIVVLSLSTFTMARQEDVLDDTKDVIIDKPADKVEDVFDDEDDDDQPYRQKPSEASPCLHDDQTYREKPSETSGCRQAEDQTYREKPSACRQAMLGEPGTAANPILVTMEELEKNPEAYYGKTVTVEGEMHRIFSDKVFTIEDDGFWRDKDVLVVSTAPMSDVVKPLADSIDPGEDVQVTGVVQPYDRAKLECAYGPLHLESREGHSFTKNPVLIIDRREPPQSAAIIELEVPAAPEPQAAAPMPAPPEPAPAAPAPAPAPAPVAQAMPQELPKTASELPLLGISGLLALCIAFVMRRSLTN
jgi:hypothetical protein